MLPRALFYSLLVFAIAVGCCSQPSRTARPTPADRPTIKVMSYNVNYGLEGDLGIIEIIRDNDCDVVFLQETTPGWEVAIKAKLSDVYDHMQFKHWSGAGGLGILSKYRFDKSGLILPPEGGWFPGWRVILKTPLGEIQALNVHLRPQISDSGSVVSGYFTTGGIRLDQIQRYQAQLDPELPILIAGDFNEDTSGDAMEYLASLGLKSANYAFHPEQATWRWKTSGMTFTSDLDHVVHDKKLEPLNAWIVEKGRSDHMPVVAIFELAHLAE
jgi:endonuclease/exonuclease/phosphatase family metal-dependent hydrolase